MGCWVVDRTARSGRRRGKGSGEIFPAKSKKKTYQYVDGRHSNPARLSPFNLLCTVFSFQVQMTWL